MQYKIVSTNVNSVINWSINAYSGTFAERIFGYYGYSIKNEVDSDIVAQARRFVEENSVPAYPQNGYFFENEDYVIVHLR